MTELPAVNEPVNGDGDIESDRTARSTRAIVADLLAGAQNTGYPIGREAAERLTELESQNDALFRAYATMTADKFKTVLDALEEYDRTGVRP